MRKCNEENERIKRRYFHYLREANRKGDASVDKVAAALVRFEESTGFKSFKSFHIEQAVAFKRILSAMVSPMTGKPLSKATISATLLVTKAFFKWLAWQPGYKSRISPSDADYFNLPAKDEAVAHAHREKPFPSIEQVLHTFRQMPDSSAIDQRNKALFAFLVVSGMRDGAVVSLKLKHVDVVEQRIFQDAREVRTKASKTLYTTFFQVAPELIECVIDWARQLREEILFGPNDPFFPKTSVGVGPNGFEATGVKRAHWANASATRKIVGDAFERAGIERFGPHSFRKTLEQLGSRRCKTPEEFKAWSQNLGHESVLTTFVSYGEVSRSRQAEIIKQLIHTKE